MILTFFNITKQGKPQKLNKMIRGRELLDVLDTFSRNFRGAGIIRGGELN